MTAIPLLAALVTLSPAQCCCPPGRSVSPFLYVRLAAPAGSKVTLYQGRAAPRTFDAGAVVGLRFGYRYRIKISNIPNHPGLTLFPSIEVYDSLHLPPKLKAADHPATLIIDEEDIESIRSSSMVNKLLYLEHPDVAEPITTVKGQTLQTNYPPHSDLFAEARKRGRVMLLMHLGQREPTRDELAYQNVPNTILHPGERIIGTPPVMPCVMQGCFQRITEEECFKDGGDRGRKVAPDPCGGLYGLDPEDTVAEFRDGRGKKSVVCSNQVCICVPRYIALRSECPVAKWEGSQMLAATEERRREEQFRLRKPAQQVVHQDALRGYITRWRPSIEMNAAIPGLLIGVKVLEATEVDLGPLEFLGSKKAEQLSPVQKAKIIKQVELARAFTGSKRVADTDQVIAPRIAGRIEPGPEIVEAEFSTRDITVCCHEVPEIPEKPLFLVKCADRDSANIGDVITFSLRYSNLGGKPITDVAITDSLSGRLEYVEGSAESDRPAVFTMQQNEANSLILRWEITGKLLAGQTGRIRFKARVR